MFGLLAPFVNARTLPTLCTDTQLKNYLDRMNNQTFLSTGGYKLFGHTRPLQNLHPSHSCPDPQHERSDLLQDRSTCPWYYQYSNDPLRFPRFILTAKPKNCGQLQTSQGSPKKCRNFSNSPIPNGICKTVEIEVLKFRKQQESDLCYTIGPEKQNITIAYGCVYRRRQGRHNTSRVWF